jgi:hypothetical protein
MVNARLADWVCDSSSFSSSSLVAVPISAKWAYRPLDCSPHLPGIPSRLSSFINYQ